MSKNSDLVSQKLEEILVKLESLEKNQRSIFAQLSSIQNSLLNDPHRKDKQVSEELSNIVDQLKTIKI